MRRTVILMLLAAAVAAVLTVVAPGTYTHFYKRLPWQQLPTQVTACGRDYIYPDLHHPVSLAAASKYAGARIRAVASTGGLFRIRSIWAVDHRGPQFANAPCGTIVWARTSDGFVAYSLSGGP